MDCPVCGHDRQRIIEKPTRSRDMDERLVLCIECGSLWYTETRPGDVLVINPETLRKERIDGNQVERYRDYLLGRGPHPRRYLE